MNSRFVGAQNAVFWHEEKLKTMTLDEKIGQMFMVAAYTNKDGAHVSQIENLIQKYHIGGLIFFQNDPLKQAYQTNYYQSISKTPLMIGIDGEWGLAMRLRNTQKFPYAMTLGALPSDTLVYEVGVAIGKQCKKLGIHVNFAPDVDINTNPKNPIIGFRSFGDNKEIVAKYGAAYGRGMMSVGVLSCAKHFPGHGDVYVDSHHDLPVVNKTKQEIDTLELYPFKYLIKDGVASIMVAHIHYPKLDNRPNRSASLSAYFIDTLLKKEMQFEGLVFTDALNMKGVSKNFAPGYADLEAFIAGNDILLFSESVPVAFELIKKAILVGKISEAELDKRVLNILKWKQFAGLDYYQPIEINNLLKDLQGKENEQLLQNVANKAVTLVTDINENIPILSETKLAVVAIGEAENSKWQESLESYQAIKFISILKGQPVAKLNQTIIGLSGYKTVVVSLHQPKIWSQQTSGFLQSDINFINQLSKTKNVILINFANPYVLNKFNAEITIINAFEDDDYYQKSSAAILFGKLKSKGKLPVKIGGNPPINLPTTKGFKANKTGVDTTILYQIDDIVKQLLDRRGTPGCRVLALKDNKIIFNKSYGYLNYGKQTKVNDSTLYDIASITKVASTTLAVMKLYEEKRLDLNKPLAFYLPELKNSNKANITLSEMLQHRAGLISWIPFYKETLLKRDSFYSSTQNSYFNTKVAANMFINSSYKDTIFKRIIDSKLESKAYKYSDLGLMLTQLVVERIVNLSIDDFVYTSFFLPMGLRKIRFNPWKADGFNNIAPTEIDNNFRNQEICAYVHDPGAAMLGGICGHAGLFSTAEDLGSIMTMLGNMGSYNGKQFLSASTIELFTAQQKRDSRRGLGFDKPDFSGKTSPASIFGSPLTFGHTGFTGTCAWTDPKYNLTFVFLSNRTYPNQENKELIKGSYRIKIHDVLYKAIGL